MAGSFTTQGLDLEALSVVQIIEQAKSGSLPHLVELKSRIQEHYAEHHSDILDCFLSQLRLPEGFDGSDPGTRLDSVAAGTSALLGLVEIFQCLSVSRGQNPVKVSTSLRLSNGAAEYTSWTRALLLETFASGPVRPSPPPLGVFHATATFFDACFKTFPRLPVLLSSQPPMLEVAIAWWTILCNESPVIYPGRERSRNPDEDGVGDAAMSMMHKLAKENPKAMAAAIVDGRICGLQTFVERSLQRMWCMLRIKQIKHLADFPEATVENANLRFLFLTTHTLMAADPRIHDAFMKEQVPSVYLTVLSGTTGRLYSRITSGSMTARDRRDQIRHINEIVDLALLPVQWVASTSARARRNMVEVTKGAMAVLGDCVQFLDEGQAIFESIFDQLKPYTPNRKVFPIMTSGLATVSRRTVALPDTSARKVYISTALHFTWGWSEMLVEERQTALCDNLKHRDRVGRSGRTPVLSERACSKCHSVVYCSLECQSEDWQAFHRSECPHMRKEYRDCKRRQRQYSYRDRKLHVNLLRYCFESNDVCLRTAAVNRSNPGVYHPTLVHRNTQMVFKDDDIEMGPGDEAGVYLQKALPFVPLYLRTRFAAIVSVFSKSVAKARIDERITRLQGSGSNMKFTNNGVGSIRLVERFFRYGGDDINVVLLLEQTKNLPTYTGRTIMESDRAADEFSRRNVAEIHFDIIGSMAYTCARRKAKPLSWEGAEWQPPEAAMLSSAY